MFARIVAGISSALFVYAAIIQLNDPDPLLWVLMYGAGAAATATVALGQRLPPWFPAAVGVVAAAWSIWLATIVFGDGDVKQMFPGEEQTGYVLVDTEEGREMGGLAIVAVVMFGFAWYAARRRTELMREEPE